MEIPGILVTVECILILGSVLFRNVHEFFEKVETKNEKFNQTGE